MKQDVKNKLREALVGREVVEMGQFKWVNLDMIRREAGDNWNRLRNRIYDASSTFIENRLDDHDVLLRCQGGFMIIFGVLEGEEAAARVEEISLALNVFFLGDQLLKKLKIEAEARSVTSEELLQIVATSVALEAEHEAEKQACEEVSRTSPKVDDTPKAATSAKHEDVDVTDWRKLPPKKTENVIEDSQEEDEVTTREDPEAQWRKDTTEHRPVEPPVWRKPPKAESSEPVVTLDPEAVYFEKTEQWDDLIFRPSWDAQKNEIFLHFCLARRLYKGRVLYGRDTLLGNNSPDLHRALDRSVCLTSQKAFQRRYAEGKVCRIGIPVHYDTIAKISDRVSYFSILQSVPQQMRKFFYFRIDGIPDGAPVSQMQEILRSMNGFGSNLLARLEFGKFDLRRFEGCGVDMFGCEIPKRVNQQEIRDGDVGNIFDLVSSAGLLKSETYLDQVREYDLLLAALSSGIRYFSGPIIAPELAMPNPKSALNIVDIHARCNPAEDEDDVAFI